MNPDPHDDPWLCCEGLTDEQVLSGNRSGFEQLHQSIGQLLKGAEDTINLPNPTMGLTRLVLLAEVPITPPLSLLQKFVITILTGVFGFILLLGFAGFIGLIIALFSSLP